jgi:hypothetical protein
VSPRVLYCMGFPFLPRVSADTRLDDLRRMSDSDEERRLWAKSPRFFAEAAFFRRKYLIRWKSRRIHDASAALPSSQLSISVAAVRGRRVFHAEGVLF